MVLPASQAEPAPSRDSKRKIPEPEIPIPLSQDRLDEAKNFGLPRSWFSASVPSNVHRCCATREASHRCADSRSALDNKSAYFPLRSLQNVPIGHRPNSWNCHKLVVQITKPKCKGDLRCRQKAQIWKPVESASVGSMGGAKNLSVLHASRQVDVGCLRVVLVVVCVVGVSVRAPPPFFV